MVSRVLATLVCLAARGWGEQHNIEYPTCREDEYPCFITQGHIKLSERDYEGAAVWMKKAADGGHASGMDAMGFLHQMGQGVEKDTGKAFEYYLKAAEGDDLQGMFHVGACYSKGIGTKADQQKANDWWHKAVDTGRHPSAAYNLAIRYEAGNSGAIKDARQAVELFTIAAEEGHMGAMYNIGVFTAYTPGPRQNQTEGCLWFENVTMAADHAQNKRDPVIARSMTNLALCYLTGHGMKHDVDEGWRWLELAASKNGVGAERARALMARGRESYETFKKPSHKDLLEL